MKALCFPPGMKLPIHPAASLLPPMHASDLAALRADLIADQQQEPIALLGGKLLDGRHRKLLLDELHRPCIYVELPSGTDPIQYVYSKAVHRNLTASQKAAAAVNFKRSFSKPARERRLANLRQFGEKLNGHALAMNGHARDLAGELFGVSGRYVDQAEDLLKQSPKLFRGVFDGAFTLSAARNRARIRKGRREIARLRRAARAAGPRYHVFWGDCCCYFNNWRLGGRFRQFGRPRCIFADPPYNNGWRYDADLWGDKLPAADYVAWCADWVKRAAGVLADDGSLFVVIDDHYSDLMGEMLRRSGLWRQPTIVWWESFAVHRSAEMGMTRAARFIHHYTKSRKPFFNSVELRIQSERQRIGDARAHPDGKVPPNVWPISRKQGTSIDRVPFEDAPPQLPIEIPERCILLSTQPGDLVVDPFSGNGTTGVAALVNDRAYIGIERSRKYWKQSKKWIQSRYEALRAEREESCVA